MFGVVCNMRDPARIDLIIDELGNFWKKNPDLRLGQIICNLLIYNSSDLFYIEDDVLLNQLRNFPK